MKRLLGIALLAAIAAVAVPAAGKADPPVRVAACQTSMNFIDYGGTAPFSGAWTWTMGGGSGGRENGPYYTPMDSSYLSNYDPLVGRGTPTLAVDYSNQTSSVIRSIEFGLIARGRLIAEIRDVGMFSPTMEISHDFRLPNLRTGSGGALTCVPLKVTFADGTIWSSSQP